MLDTHALIGSALRSQSSITSLVTFTVDGNERVFICWPDMAQGFNPTKGHKGLAFFARGPADNPELPAFDDQSIQVKTWALKMTDAMAVFGAVCDFLDQAQQVDVAPHGVIISAFREMPPQPMFDPDTGWATVTGFFRLAMRAN